MAKWDRTERRKSLMNQDERDLLIRIDQNVDNLINRFENHTETDVKTFGEHSDRLKILERAIWLGMGGLALLQFIIKVYK